MKHDYKQLDHFILPEIANFLSAQWTKKSLQLASLVKAHQQGTGATWAWVTPDYGE